MFTYRKITSVLSSFILIFSLMLTGFQPVSVSAQGKDGLKRQVNQASHERALQNQDVPPTETPPPTETAIPAETSLPIETPTPAPTDAETPIPTETSLSDTVALPATICYVATTGNDANSCTNIAAPCLTINGAIGKAAGGETIEVANGTYTGTGTEVVLIDKSITLSGGWDASFTSQTDISTIDGQGTRRGIKTLGTSITTQGCE